jgi:DNA-directed RNA polymerase specialized sigma subunit
MNDYTQTETSKLVGISQVQVSRKEQKILQKLKEKMIA